MPRHRAKERACEAAIKRTLSYRSTFSYPLSLYQLSTYLISKRRFKYDFFKKILRRQLKNKSVRVRREKYYLPAIKPVSWRNRMSASIRILKKNDFVFDIMMRIPWLRMIGVTGSLGSYNSTKNSDIDLFIITQKNRLWLSRLFVVLILKILQKYPLGSKDKGKMCPNIMIDEKNLAWPKDKRNLYIANEILLLQPVRNKDDTYFWFVRENDWIFAYFSNFKIQFPKNKHQEKNGSELVDFLENMARKMQIKYMKKKITTETVKKGFIHFNINDSTQKVIKSYRDSMERLDLK